MTLKEIKEYCASSLMFKNATHFQQKDYGWFFTCDGRHLMAVVNPASNRVIGVWDV